MSSSSVPSSFPNRWIIAIAVIMLVSTPLPFVARALARRRGDIAQVATGS